MSRTQTAPVPPIPREAAPWAVDTIVGRQAIGAAWEGVFKAGVEVGKVEARVDHAVGLFQASAFWLTLYLITIGAAALAKGGRGGS